MQQTALNLIAIGVFTITISSLLGPILHISPTIPAVATLFFMGLATVDTLTWENKGVTILLDIFASAEQRQRVIRHEAGHFLAAYKLGIPITGYTLTAWEAFKKGQLGLGGVTFNTETLSEKNQRELSLTVERFCTVFMAGIAAEKIIYGNTEGGGDDRQKLRLALQETGALPSTYQAKENWAQLQARSLIEKNLEAYHALVKAMESRLSVQECYQIIQETDLQKVK